MCKTKDAGADVRMHVEKYIPHSIKQIFVWRDYLPWWAGRDTGRKTEEATLKRKTQKRECFSMATPWGLLHLPADSPVLIQSGFAMLAIAKISAARNRQPEMMVSLSMSSAWWTGWLKDVGGNASVVARARSSSSSSPGCGETQGGSYRSNLAPLPQQALTAELRRLCILSPLFLRFRCFL